MRAEELLKKGYQAYGDHVGWKAHTGKQMPVWEDLPDQTKGAWAAFLKAVLAEVQK